MEDMLSKELQEIVLLMEDQGARDVILLDISKSSSWADHLFIATITSNVQASGIVKRIRELMHGQDREVFGGSSRKSSDNEWILLDCGDIVINLMTRNCREFYQLEELWFEAEKMYQSSKSS